MEQQILKGLKNEDFFHPFDKDAMGIINMVPGLDKITEFVVSNSVETIYNIQLKGASLRITEQNAPKVFKAFNDAANVLEMDELPDIYLNRGYHFFNRIIGYKNPIVLLHTNCIDQLNDIQLRFIAGRCLGGLRLKHNKLEFLCDVSALLSGFFPGVVTALSVPLAQWHRKSELSRDRAGLLACQDFESAIQVLMLMSGTPYGTEQEVDIYDYLDQAVLFQKSKGLEGFGRTIETLTSNNAWIIERASELLNWHESGKYDEILMNYCE